MRRKKLPRVSMRDLAAKLDNVTNSLTALTGVVATMQQPAGPDPRIEQAAAAFRNENARLWHEARRMYGDGSWRDATMRSNITRKAMAAALKAIGVIEARS